MRKLDAIGQQQSVMMSRIYALEHQNYGMPCFLNSNPQSFSPYMWNRSSHSLSESTEGRRHSTSTISTGNYGMPYFVNSSPQSFSPYM